MKDRLLAELKRFASTAALFLALAAGLRIAEWILIVGKAEVDGRTAAYEWAGIFFDLPFLLAVVSCVGVVGILIALVHSGTGKVAAIFIFSVLLLIDAGLMFYFSTTLLPLSADLYGYTLYDIRTTVASEGVSFLKIVLPALLLVVFVWVAWTDKIKVSNTASYVLLGAGLVSWALPHAPAPESFDRDLDYYIAVDKTQYFVNRSISYFKELSEEPSGNATPYPFRKSIPASHELASLFNKGEHLPNFVVIAVEGLGRDFTGPNAEYGGFTPFLDSLANHSLYWKNFLSNGGRTFAALPSLMGSLPYGQNGFMSYGPDLPDHQTLISLLRRVGYRSQFFYGGNPNFDGQDVFLEYEQVDYALDATRFRDKARQDYLIDAGFSWGYPDAEMFQEAITHLTTLDNRPRLDFFLTLSTHEPFFVPDSTYAPKVEQKLAGLKVSAEKREVMQANKNIFECLLYTDESIKQLMHAYQKRPDFDNTIFIITGDHRLIPLPQRTKLARFHVPLLVYSPLLKEPKMIGAMGAHSDVMVSLLGLLSEIYGVAFPGELNYISGPLKTDAAFSPRLDLALIRNKGETKDYISGFHFLSEERLYQVTDGLDLNPVNDPARKKELMKKLKEFKTKSIYAIESNQLDKLPEGSAHKRFVVSQKESEWIKGLHLAGADTSFMVARQFAFDDRYNECRTLLHDLLNKSPNYHDARILLARTYAWNKEYDSARYYLHQTIARTASYADAFVALSDVEYWSDDVKKSLEVTWQGLQLSAKNVELRAREARALLELGKKTEARKIIVELANEAPDNELVKKLSNQIK